jgi:hypothetical protein
LTDLRALRERRTSAEVWKGIATEYRNLPQSSTPEEEQRRQNNLAVALYRAGTAKEARETWQLVASAGAHFAAPMVNLYASAPPAEREQLWKSVEQLLGESRNENAKRIAQTWHIRHTVKGKAEQKKKLRELEHEIADEGLFALDSGIPGVALDKSVQLGVGYSSSEGLVTQLNITATPWLFLE